MSVGAVFAGKLQDINFQGENCGGHFQYPLMDQRKALPSSEDHLGKKLPLPWHVSQWGT